MKDPRVDEYIAQARPFAKPVLRRIRKVIHKTIPEIQENIKWGFASFEYKGLLCSMGAFKEHCVFGFWKHALINDPNAILQERSVNGGDAMGNLGRIKSVADLPDDEILTGFLLQAKKLNDDGIKLPAKNKTITTVRTELIIPVELSHQLKTNKKAAKAFESMSYSNKKEYCLWIDEAKREETRLKRTQMAIEWIAKGKGRNWKYEKG